MKISEAFDEYRRREIRGRGCSPNTDKAYSYTSRVVTQYFGDVQIRKIGIDDISNFYLDLTGGGAPSSRIVSKDTAKEYVSKLRSVIRFCRRRGIKVLNPDEIVTPKSEKKYARFIDCGEYRRFLEEIGRPRRGYSNLNRMRNVLICKMLFNTGLRVGELCALNRDTIHDRQFTVVGKSKEPRPCFITKEIEDDIEAYLRMRDDDNPALFISDENKSRVKPSNVQQIFRRTAHKTGMAKVTPHTMRHSFATRLIEDGVDIRYVAEFLGHQSLNTTKRYTHIRDYKMRQIYQTTIEKG